MIKLLGFRRVLVLSIMLGINLLFAAVYFLWASPKTMTLDRDLRSLRVQISGLQTDIQNVQADMKMLSENLPFYDSLLAGGFLQEQDRFAMSRALESIKSRSHVQGFAFSVGDIRELPSADAQMAGKRLLHSRVQIERVAALTDINFFDMLEMIEKDYPIHARIHSFELARSGSLTQDVLNRIGETPVSLISARVTFDWFSLGDRAAASSGGVPGGYR